MHEAGPLPLWAMWSSLMDRGRRQLLYGFCTDHPAKKSVAADRKPEPIPQPPRCPDRDPQIPERFSVYNQAWGPHLLPEI